MNAYRFQDLEMGHHETFSVTLTQGMMKTFQDLTGDDNPLHCDKSYAAAKGFSNCVSYGLLTASFYSTLIGVYLPGRYALLHGIDVTFSKPAFVGDTLSIRGEISHKNKAYQQIEIRAVTRNQKDIVLSRAILKVGLLE